MKDIELAVSSFAIPVIYAYSTPTIPDHSGWLKIGYTEQNIKTRIDQQTHTVDVPYVVEWFRTAIYTGGTKTGQVFDDKAFHRYLRVFQYENDPSNEWFKITKEESLSLFEQFSRSSGDDFSGLKDMTIPYKLRSEQESAVEQTISYFKDHSYAEYLWNAKPRFGKTLATYDLIQKMGFERVLILTNRPVIGTSWYDDYIHFVGVKSPYCFVSRSSRLVNRDFVIHDLENAPSGNKRIIEFESLQDVKGARCFGGGDTDKFSQIPFIDWDLLVLDEAHEGVDTDKTNRVLELIKRRYTLHLSGTPFKQLANEKFDPQAIFYWTYADEQRKKKDWHPTIDELENPYRNLPQLNLYTYKMSDIIEAKISEGASIDDQTYDYAFDLNEFFATKDDGHFKHRDAIDKFITALTTNKKFPYSTYELRQQIRHSFWLLDRVDSVRELAKILRKSVAFEQYRIIEAVGDFTETGNGKRANAYDQVIQAVKSNDKPTITLSVGQLTTGVTIPQWSAVLVLCNVASASLYMQTAFRAQNPCLYYDSDKNEYYRKENAYIFDFDPARTLSLYETFANDLGPDSNNSYVSSDQVKSNVKELLNFFPVIAEDSQGEMVSLDATQVLTVPRKMKSTDVVRRGFMSNYLFKNVANVFAASSEILTIINKFQPIRETKDFHDIQKDDIDDLPLDNQGNVDVNKDLIIGVSHDVFGEKIYGDNIQSVIKPIVSTINVTEPSLPKALDENREQVKSIINQQIVQPLLETAKENYGEELPRSLSNQLEKRLSAQVNSHIDSAFANAKKDIVLAEKQYKDGLNQSTDSETDNRIQSEYHERLSRTISSIGSTIQKSLDQLTPNLQEEIVTEIETHKVEKKRDETMDQIRDHLRGFTRTIPSFIMAYGSTKDSITLANIDTIVPDNVFKEVTSISLKEFRLLRDGGDYTAADGSTQYYSGHLFDETVFNDSVNLFLEKKRELANYFDEANGEDIFDYIPPQKTNQIFTPKRVVKQMVDLLEQENPGCFDDPNKTFADLYMKSGLYITEIVKRLFNSPKMKALYPDDDLRLKHIFANQMYGLAPTEIIYRIVISYVLGFTSDPSVFTHHLCLLDSLDSIKKDELESTLSKLFPELKGR